MTLLRLRCAAFLRRAIRSPMGSLTICVTLLPARLDEAGDQALRTQVAERNPAHLQLAIICARTPGDLATVADAGLGRVPRQFRQLQPGVEAFFERQALIIG